MNRHNEAQRPPRNRRCEIKLPARMDLGEHFEETITHMANVRLASRDRLRLYLNFDNIRHISPSAALVLASEVDRWNGSLGGRLRARDRHWDPNIKRLLCEMGFFDLLHLAPPPDLGIVTNTTFLQFLRGNVEQRGNGGLLAQMLGKRIEAAAGREIRRHLLFDGLTEAITNVSQHAYRKDPAEAYRPWWMFAAYTRSSNTIIVSFYDHGLTIPTTLPASKGFEWMKDKLGFWNDGERIKAAMQYGRSATEQTGRGKGLQNFLEIIEAHPGSKLTIFSNKGKLIVANGVQNGLEFDSSVLETSLLGTLIEWQFAPLTISDGHFNR